VPSQTNCAVDVRRPARLVYDALLRRGDRAPVRELPTSLRVTFGLPEENDRFLRALGEAGVTLRAAVAVAACLVLF
jgi:histidinol-phosphate/aromatic aminotransferase/cobyric acid decarboxylase-like protein